MAKSFLNNSQSRGLRNNNPGNLIRTNDAWQGKVPFSQSKDAKFEQFYELKWGMRALFKDIINDIGKGQNTITKIISAYAPPSENNTVAYIQSVAARMNVGVNSVLSPNKETLILLAKAIVLVELGATYAANLTDDDYLEGYLHLNSTFNSDELPELGITSVQNVCKYCGHILGAIILFFFTFFAMTF
jgi:hypothetical protein